MNEFVVVCVRARECVCAYWCLYNMLRTHVWWDSYWLILNLPSKALRSTTLPLNYHYFTHIAQVHCEHVTKHFSTLHHSFSSSLHLSSFGSLHTHSSTPYSLPNMEFNFNFKNRVISLRVYLFYLVFCREKKNGFKVLLFRKAFNE